MPAPMTRELLDQMAAGGCAEPGCGQAEHPHGPLFIHGRCHVGGRLDVSYAAGSGVVKVGC